MSTESLLSRAETLAREGDPEEALALLDQAVAEAPEDPTPYVHRAALFAAAGYKTAMLRDLGDALELDPRAQDAIGADPRFAAFRCDPFFRRLALPDEDIDWAVDEMYEGDFEAAASRFAELKAGAGEAPWLDYYLSICLHQLGRPEDALRAADAAIAGEPRLAEAHFNRACALEALDRREEAERAYEETARLEPDHQNAQYNLGMLHQGADRLGDALAALDEAVAIDPEFGLALYQRAVTHARLGHREAMLEDLAAVIALDPDAAESAAVELAFTPYREDPAFVALTSPPT